MADDPTPMEARPHRRRIPKRVPIAILVILLGAGLAWWLTRPDRSEPEMLSGYIQSDNLYLSSPVAGTIKSVSAKRGDMVERGARLFTLDPATLDAAAGTARANVSEAEAQSATESDNEAVARAEYQAQAAEAERAARDLRRYLAADAEKPGAVARQQIDAARAAATTAARQRDAARERVHGAAARVRAARARIEASRASLSGAQARVGELSPAVPARARVEDILYQPGEWVAANKPIVSLIPNDKIKVRFYAPERSLPLYRPGRIIHFSCDGCPAGLIARIDYVSPRPEHTPPVIYSHESRDKLVFMVEARPTQAHRLAPGQPVDVAALDNGREER